jgi:hypothetical protein
MYGISIGIQFLEKTRAPDERGVFYLFILAKCHITFNSGITRFSTTLFNTRPTLYANI